MRNRDIQGCIEYIADSDDVSIERLFRIKDYIEQLESEVETYLSILLRIRASIKDFDGDYDE